MRSVKGRADHGQTIGLRVVKFQFFDVRQQFLLVGQADEVWLIRKNLTHNNESTIPGEGLGVWPWIAAFGGLGV